MKLKKTQGILATAAKPEDLQAAFTTASKAAKIMGCATLKKVDDKVWGPKMAGGKKAEFVIDAKPDATVLNMTFKLHIGSEYSTLGVAKKTDAEMKNDALQASLKNCGLM